MPGERQGVVEYFQLGAILSFDYTICHGISPQVAVVRCLPGANFNPGATGDVVFGDGVGAVKLRNCKIIDVTAVGGTEGQEFILRLEDRRWQWVDFGAIKGEYNQLDPHQKLILRTIRSPQQLAKLCLQEMGEENYVIDLPPGLEGPQEAPDFLPPGTFSPPSATNPPVAWNYLPPMVALQELAEQYGRRVVLRLDSNAVWIVQPGIGEELPSGNLSDDSAAIKLPDKPDVVACAGAPTRYDFRGLLQAVGREWDGTLKPLAALSYCPTLPGKKQITKVTVHISKDAPVKARKFKIFVAVDANTEVIEADTTSPSETNAANMLAGAAAVVGDFLPCTVALAGNELTFTGKKEGVAFSVTAQVRVSAGAVFIPANDAGMDVRIVQPATQAEKSFKLCPPPLFPTIQKTDRLTREQAIRLAQESVWKYYRMILQSPDGSQLVIPGYGTVDRIQQVYALPTKVRQIVPDAGELVFKTRDGFTLIKNYYDGYSRDMPAEVFGSVSRWLLNATYIRDAAYVTQPKDPVFVPFEIDPDFNLVKFSDFVYTIDDSQFVTNLLLNLNLAVLGAVAPNPLGGAIIEPRLVLETSCHVRDPVSNEFVRYVSAKLTPGQRLGTNAKFSVHDDVQLMFVSEYDDQGDLVSVTPLEDDPRIRAQYYVDGMALQYPTSSAQTRSYNGIVPIYLDGAIQQVTWHIGTDGFTTTASRNSEHHPVIPEYPARRRAERLPPARPQDVMVPDMRRKE